MTCVDKQAQLVGITDQLIAHLQRELDPALTDDAAQQLLARANVLTAYPCRQLSAHLSAHPDALINPSRHCPASLLRLIQTLVDAGYASSVTLLACARCGRTERQLRRTTPAGRCCERCANTAAAAVRRCARCGRDDYLVARRAEGSICRRCKYADPATHQKCAECGRTRPVKRRRDDGQPLCQMCAPSPSHTCASCGTQAPAATQTPDGPLCKSCYTTPAGFCGVCGHTRPIKARANATRPDTCYSCYRNLGTCDKCGRTANGGHYRGGAFLCAVCWPRTPRTCGICQTIQPTHNTWPVGPICQTCYDRRTRNPGLCAGCDTRQVLIARSPDGADLCGSCSGSSLTYSCRRCGRPGDNYADGTCMACVAAERVREFLSDTDGVIAEQLHPLADALIAASPHGVLQWISRSTAAASLRVLIRHRLPLSHDVLDRFPQDHALHRLREILVGTAILPRRHEPIAQLQLWVKTMVGELPQQRQNIIRPFAEWAVVRDARRRAHRGRYTVGASAVDRCQIREAIRFLNWLDYQGIPLAEVGQGHVDLWIDQRPASRWVLGTFTRWCTKRKLTGSLDVIKPPSSHYPLQLLHEDEHHQQLRRCLTDESLPLTARIIGSLIRLYGVQIPRMVELTVDKFHQDESGAYLTINANPVLLPPRLAQLIERHIAQPPRSIHHLRNDEPRYLFPGSPPSRPRNPATIHALLRKHGLPSIAARNTALIEAALELPPVIMCDLFGIHPQTAHYWAQYASSSWADYLAASTEREEEQSFHLE
jgi:hypothetical protein